VQVLWQIQTGERYFVNLSPLIISIQPVGRGGGNILDGMANTPRNKHLVARLCQDFLFTDDQSEFPNHDSHKLVRCVDEIIPLSARRVGKHIAGIALLAPVTSDLVTIERHGEFLIGEIGY
jgi:hypothetical protein